MMFCTAQEDSPEASLLPFPLFCKTLHQTLRQAPFWVKQWFETGCFRNAGAFKKRKTISPKRDTGCLAPSTPPKRRRKQPVLQLDALAPGLLEMAELMSSRAGSSSSPQVRQDMLGMLNACVSMPCLDDTARSKQGRGISVSTLACGAVLLAQPNWAR